jgi:hypothetical protein
MRSLKLLISSVAMIALLILAIIYPFSSVSAYSDGPYDPAEGSNIEGIGSEIWMNPKEIATPGSPYASVSLYQGHRYSNYLEGNQYSFALPVDADITGIEVSISHQSSSPNLDILDNVVSLVKGGVIVGDNKADQVTPWGTTFVVTTYGGPTDLWGSSWIPADINSLDFGVVLAVYRNNNGNKPHDALVDSMQITVYYGYSTTSSVQCGDGSPITYGDSTVCSVTVSRSVGGQTPSGAVDWTSDGSGVFDPNPCVLEGANGIATCSATYTPLAVGNGSHLVTATYNGNDFFSGSYASQTLDVLTRPITVTADALSKAFGQADPPFTYQITQGSLVFSDTFTGSLTREPGEDVGLYAILQGSLALPASYDLSFVSNTFTIYRADPTCDVTPYDLAYDATEHLASGTCTGAFGEDLPGLDLSLTAHTEAGDYTDPWTFTDQTGNYNDANGTVNDLIGKADATCDVTSYDLTYDGLPHSAEGTCTGVLGEALDGLDLSASTHTEAGNYTDPWTFTDQTGNYNDAIGSVNDLIGKADATCDLTPYDLTYDATEHLASGACTGVLGEDLPGLDLSLTAHTDAGSYTDPWAFTDQTGNYNDASGSVNDFIGMADATCDVTSYDLTYDGLPHTAEGACSGVLGEPLQGLDLSATTHTNAGNYPADPWSFTDLSGNYHSQNGTVDDHIGQADPTCDITPYNVVYDGNAHSASGACTGVLGEPLQGLDLSDTSHTDAGSYLADPWSFTDTSGNYLNTSGSVDDVIERADPACEITPYDVTYDANAHSASGACSGVLGEPLQGLDLSGTTHTDAGSYSDPWTFTSPSENYNDANGTVTDLIGKADATCLVTGYTAEYDQEFHIASGECTGILGEALAGLDLSGTRHMNVGVFPDDVWIFIDAMGNYNDVTGTVSDEIIKRHITVTADPKTKLVGQPDPEFTYRITSGSLLIFDSFTGELTREPGEDIGVYQILQGTLALPDYYELTYIGAKFTIISGKVFLPIIVR